MAQCYDSFQAETAESIRSFAAFEQEFTMNDHLCTVKNFFFFSFSFTDMNSKVDLLC